MEKTLFGLIRHGRTRWNEEKRIQGHLDSPLSSAGHRMARQWGRQLATMPWQRILASDLGRVRETVQEINQILDLPVDNDPRLREQDWGEWSGLTFPWLYAHREEALRRQVKAGWDFRPPGGESRREVLVRAREALLDAAGRRPGQQILVVCHEGIIKCLLYQLLHRKFLPGKPKLLRGYQLHLLTSNGRTITLQEPGAMALSEGSDVVGQEKT